LAKDDPIAPVVGVAIEEALLKIGMPVHKKVSKMLQLRYATFADCYRNPELLSSILKQIFGEGYKSIIKEIKKESIHYERNHPVAKFFKKLD
jgi:hypothetical protein